MTAEELETRINELTKAANSLEQPDKTFALNEIDRIHMEIEGMALEELRRRLEQVRFTDLQEIDGKIAAARDATKALQFRVDAFNIAIGILKTAIKFVI